MYTKDAIRYSLNMADQATMRAIETIKDAPLTFPTGQGGCHPLWVIGHLAFIEGLTHEMLGGGGNPVAHWAAIFGQDTVPAADATAASRIDDGGGSGQADALAAERPRGALRDIWEGSVDDCDASDGPSRANHRRDPGSGPRYACFGGGGCLAGTPLSETRALHRSWGEGLDGGTGFKAGPPSTAFAQRAFRLVPQFVVD
jgi:hypothetical protein